jgi:hypothetical protein
VTHPFIVGPAGAEWFNEYRLTLVEDPPPGPAPVRQLAAVLTIVAAPGRCRRCRYLTTRCACPGGARGL